MRNNVTFACVAVSALAAAIAAAPACAELFVDLGAHSTRVEADIANAVTKATSTESGLHVGIGVRRMLAGRGEIGVRLELDNVDSDLLLAVRAFDYRYRLSDRFAIGAFIGAARLDLATPAYGYYLGGGVHVAKVLPEWDLGAELRIGDKIARDNLLPSDPQGGRPDNFYDLTGVSLYLTRRF
jgi:hypothetical protein